MCDGHAAVLKIAVDRWKRDSLLPIPTEQQYLNILRNFRTEITIIPVLLPDIQETTYDVTTVERIRSMHQFLYSGPNLMSILLFRNSFFNYFSLIYP